MPEYIEREAAINVINKFFVTPVGKSIMEKVPSADVRLLEKCKWENLVRCGFASVEATCTACGKTLIYKSWWNFCPNCGAQVEKEQENK